MHNYTEKLRAVIRFSVKGKNSSQKPVDFHKTSQILVFLKSQIEVLPWRCKGRGRTGIFYKDTWGITISSIILVQAKTHWILCSVFGLLPIDIEVGVCPKKGNKCGKGSGGQVWWEAGVGALSFSTTAWKDVVKRAEGRSLLSGNKWLDERVWPQAMPKEV